MDLDDPGTLEAGPTGGLLRDLGSHLVDKMLWLLGPVFSVDAQMDMVERPQGSTDAGFALTLCHASGVHSHLSASKLNHLAVKEYRAYGEAGCYVSSGTDVQAQAIFAGCRPVDDLERWGYEDEALWGALHPASGVERIASEQGRYHDYYEAFARAVLEGVPAPVTAAEAVATLAPCSTPLASAHRKAGSLGYRFDGRARPSLFDPKGTVLEGRRPASKPAPGIVTLSILEALRR